MTSEVVRFRCADSLRYSVDKELDKLDKCKRKEALQD